VFVLELPGIEKQSEVGFMTLLEHLRYCSVGTYLKNPCNPIWVLGSDTHLTGIGDDFYKNFFLPYFNVFHHFSAVFI